MYKRKQGVSLNTQNSPDRGAIDLQGIAAYLKISERTAWQLCRDGVIPAKQVGRQWRSTQAQLDAFLASPSGMEEK